MKVALIPSLVLLAASASAAEVGDRALALIADSCLSCHNAETKSNGLDLSGLDAAKKGGQSGPALVPGDVESSLLWKRVANGSMPLGNPLPGDQREIIRQWIEAGAPWEASLAGESARARSDENWWAWQPLQQTEPPSVSDAPQEWRRSPIDRFLIGKMREKNLAPAPPADRRTLIRRATFDLTGLPPTPEEVAAFANDDRPGAYEELIDRLLASPRYGERWGRHWLDVVRFGESFGYEKNWLRDDAWPFRDYVIRAFNDDKPFNRMIIEHLAGDQSAPGELWAEAGTGFLVAGPHDQVGIENIEGKLQKRANDLDDMITATASAFLGLTVNCARCHDHKFDPIEQKDYYRMQAVFAGVEHADRVWATPNEVAARKAEVAPLELELQQVESELDTLRADSAERVEARRDEIFGRYRPSVDPYLTEETFDAAEARFVRMRIESGTRGAGVSLDEFEVWTAENPPRNVALVSVGAEARTGSTRLDDASPDTYAAANLIDGKFDKGWISDGTLPEFVEIELAQPALISRISFSGDRTKAFQGRFGRSVPERFVIEVSLDEKSWREVANSYDRLPTADEQRERLSLFAVFNEHESQQWTTLEQRQRELKKQIATVPKTTSAYLGAFKQPEEPTHLHKRGNPSDPGDVIAPGGVSTLGRLFEGFELDPAAPEAERRLALARWIADDRNALSLRVMANRVWGYHFGRGFVATPSDFGVNGGEPTHPELLDFLAGRLLDHGWRLKPLHREIMLSAAYRQSGRHDEGHAAIDTDAAYLWRFPPRRLEAEAIRDTILAVAGKLDLSMGGPGFRLYRYTVDNVATYYPREEFGEETFRRAVYHQSARSVKAEMLGEYDCPDSSLAAPKREVTTSPLQALGLMNNSFVLDQARFFAERLEEEVGGSDPREQVVRAYELAFGRGPSEEELRLSVELIHENGLIVFCRALLNANEFVYVM